jgi:putative DNA methylase
MIAGKPWPDDCCRYMRDKKKLIEVALPLEAINKAAKEEKSVPRRGHPQTLHYWWARRPLAAARAVIFAQMVDDPSGYVDVLLSDNKLRRKAERELKEKLAEWTKRLSDLETLSAAGDSSIPEAQAKPTLEEVIANIERQRLFRIIEDLVLWENTTNKEVLDRARSEIWQSWRRACAESADHPRAKELFNRHKLPAFHDPFAGGGTLALEAQRLGLESHASDLNPIAVLISKAMIEIAPRFAGRPPVNPEARADRALFEKTWAGTRGLADDVCYYGKWMRDEAEKRIGQLYPRVEVTSDMAMGRPDLKPLVGQHLTALAWLWARAVKSPNPAFTNVDVPLASTFMLCTKPSKEAYVEPVIDDKGYRFAVRVGKPKNVEAAKNGTKLSRGPNFQCVMSGAPIPGDYIKAEGKAGRMASRLMAVMAESECGRVYLPPTEAMEAIARQARPQWMPDGMLVEDPRAFTPTLYGLEGWSDLFTPRQLVALTTFSDLVQEVYDLVKGDALVAGLPDDAKLLDSGGTSATAYSQAVSVYLGCALGRLASYNNTICHWNMRGGSVGQIFARQAISMSWDYIEVHPLEKMSGNWVGGVEWVGDVLRALVPEAAVGSARQLDASTQNLSTGKVVSTDPPYYDNVPYADLSDFFYVWLRPSLKSIFPDLFATLAVPKAEELVATSYRHGSKGEAEAFFLDGMTQAMHCLAEQAHPAFPVTVYYAFKQSESDGGERTASTGWETFLDAVIRAGFALSGTWPMRTEREGRPRGFDSNALASSVVLVCRPRAADAPDGTRHEFVTLLRAELPAALAHLQRSNIAPVDLAQAAIGPGMAVYTRYARVLDAEGKPIPVREALALINQTLDEALAEQEGDFDADTRWALAWFEQSGFTEGEYGVAETLSKAKNTTVDGMARAGIVASRGGKVRLLRPDELPPSWDPAKDTRLTSWDMVHHLIRLLEAGGEGAAAELAAKLGAKAEIARELAYRLYTVCERKKRAQDALSYNGLVQSWPEITRLARESGTPQAEQGGLFELE